MTLSQDPEIVERDDLEEEDNDDESEDKDAKDAISGAVPGPNVVLIGVILAITLVPLARGLVKNRKFTKL